MPRGAGEAMAAGGLRSAWRLAADRRRGAGSARCGTPSRQVKGSSRDPAVAFLRERTQLLGCWLCPSAPGGRRSCASGSGSISVRSVAHRLFFTGAVPGFGFMFSHLTPPAKEKLFFFSPPSLSLKCLLSLSVAGWYQVRQILSLTVRFLNSPSK